MRTLSTICLCLLLAACGVSQTAPTEIAAVRALLTQEVAIIALGINREDPIMASQPVSDSFTMGGNVATRYGNQGWGGTGVNGVAWFRAFFGGTGGAFAVNANIEQTMQLTDVELQGTDLATAVVYTNFSSVRVDKTPPEIVPPQIEPWRDLMVFQREGGAWRLITWDWEPLPPHDEGEGGTV
jgi:hypothetical protein